MENISYKNEPQAETEIGQEDGHYGKRLKFIGLMVAVMGLLAVGLYFLGWPRLLQWRQERSLVEAARYEKAGDYRRALLIFEQAVQLYPGNMEAQRQQAAFLERMGQREGLESWKQIARTEPTNPRNWLGLAGAALRFGDAEVVRGALMHLRQAGQDNADYYRLAAGLALLTRDNPALESALTELARLQPAEIRTQLNLAIVRLHSSDPIKAEAARSELMVLARTDQVRIRAVVELLNDMASRWPRPARERVTAFQNLAQFLTPARGPRDELAEAGDPVERLIAFALGQPAPEPEDAGALLGWLILNGRGAVGFAWLETLPEKTRNSRLVTVAASDAALQAADWPHLRELLLAGAWGSVPAPVVNGAFALAESRRESGLNGGDDPGQWAAVVAAGQSSLPALRMLLRLSEAWQWPEEHRQVLTAITRNFAGETWAWRQLISYALARGDSEQLWQVYRHWSRAAPGDTTVQIETAIMGLLLQKREAASIDNTAEFVRLQPGNAGALVAHALALWRGRRLAEALPLLDALPPSAFTEPRYALVYGLILAEAGRARESEQMLNRAAADRLLSDEMLLVEQARARNQLRLPPAANW